MGVLVKGHTFADNEQVTSTKVNNLVDNATFSNDAVDDSTIQISSNKLAVKTINTGQIANSAVTTAKLANSTGTSDGVTTAKIADQAVTTAKIADFNVTTAKIADANVTLAKLSLPSNFPIQVVSATKTDTQTITSTTTSWTDVSGLSITLTRAIASASGKVRIQANIQSTTNNGNHGIAYRIVRGSSDVIGVGDAASLRLQATTNTGYAGSHSSMSGVIDFIDDSPGSSSTVTYKIQAKVYSAITGYINRTNSDTNAGDYSFRTISTMTLTELAP